MENNAAKSVVDLPAMEKIDSPEAKPHKSRLSSLRRWLRYATLTMLGVMFCMTLVFWIRSYWRIDHLHGFLGGDHRLFVRSGGGEVVIAEYTLLPQSSAYAPFQSWEARSFEKGTSFNSAEEFGLAVVEGIHWQSDSNRPVRGWWSDSDILAPSRSLFLGGPSPLAMTSHGVAFPHLLLLLITGSLFFLIIRRWRFSLRAFFIWVTIACVAMACAVAFATAVKEIPFFHVID